MLVFDQNVHFDEASEYRWDALNESLFLTRVFESLRQQLGPSFHRYTFHIFSAHNTRAAPLSAQAPGPRKVLFSISDETGAIPLPLQKDYFAIFKAYLPRDAPGTNIFSLNIGYVKDTPHLPVKPADERKLDLFFCGNLNDNRFALYSALHPLLRFLPPRVCTSLLHRLKRNPAPGASDFPAWLRRDFSGTRSYLRFTGGFRQGLPPAEYARLLHESRIALCPKGFHSAETFRHFEALRAGCVVISGPLPDTHWYRGAPIQIAPDWPSGIRLARALARDGRALLHLQQRSLDWWKNVCREQATAAYIRATLNTLEAQPIHPAT